MDFSSPKELYHHLRRRCEHYENTNDVQKLLADLVYPVLIPGIAFILTQDLFRIRLMPGSRLSLHASPSSSTNATSASSRNYIHTNRHDAFEKTLVQPLRPHNSVTDQLLPHGGLQCSSRHRHSDYTWPPDQLQSSLQALRYMIC
jgi:hypothetical protein